MVDPELTLGSYDEPRGTCPACASDDVDHLIIGLMTVEAFERHYPEWAKVVGCCHPGFDRSCGTCGASWSFDRPEEWMRERVGT